MSFEKSPCFVLDLSESDLKGGERHYYEFKSFRLEVEERQLLHRETPIPLTPKAFDVLALLVARSGHLVLREELLQSVWADSFVEEQNITRVIHTLRRALGEDDDGDKFIETVAKKGYRFVAEVTSAREEEKTQNKVSGRSTLSLDEPSEQAPFEIANLVDIAPSLASEFAPSHSAEHKPQTRIILFALGFLTAVSLLVLLSLDYRSDSERPSKVISIAVLPVRPLNAAEQDEVYEMGIAEALINTLGPMKGLIVRPLSATRNYRDVDQDPIAAGREQKVDYVVASNYQIADGRIRITSQLFNVATGQIDQTYKSEKDPADLFAMQDAIAGDIRSKLVLMFGLTVTGTQTKRGTNNEEAYRLYLQGKNLTMKRTRADSKKALECLEQAIRLDPNFAAAFAHMARVYRSSDPGPEEKTEKVKEFINRALELDPELADAYVARAEEVLLRDWNFQSVEKDLAKALVLEPNNDTARWLWALLLANRGRFDEALTEIDVAQAIDPGAVMYMFHRGRILYYARRYEEAMTQYRQAMALDDRFVQPYGWTFRIYEIKGDYASAYQFFLKREERSPRKDRLESYQRAYEAAGWMGVSQLTAETDGGFFDLARLHALRGEKDEAFEALNKAFDKREWMMTTLKVEPAFDSLRDDLRFAALIKRVGLE